MIHEQVAQFVAQDMAELIGRAVLIPVDDTEGGIGQGDGAGHLQGCREIIRDPVGIVPDRGKRNQGNPHISGQAERIHRKPANPGICQNGAGITHSPVRTERVAHNPAPPVLHFSVTACYCNIPETNTQHAAQLQIKGSHVIICLFRSGTCFFTVCNRKD